MKTTVVNFVPRNRSLLLIICFLILSCGVIVIDRQAGARSLVPAPPPPPVIYAVDRFNNRLRSFVSNAPGVAASNVALTGLRTGEQLIGIDFRPDTGVLYAIGTDNILNRVLTINTVTGEVTPVGSGFTSPGISTTSFYGFDFDPVLDQIRVTSFTDMNFRVDPDSGTVIAIDTNLAFAPGDPNFGDNPAVDLLGISSYFPGAPNTTAFAVDIANGVLVRVGGPNSLPSASNGQLTTIGSLGLSSLFQSGGFDIGLNGDAFLTLNNNLYSENLTTGHATLVGTFSFPVDGIAIQPPNALPPVPFIVTAPNAGSQNSVNVFEPISSNMRLQTNPFGTLYRGGVRVAVGDVTGDGNTDLIVGKATGDSRVRVFNGRDGSSVRDFFAFAGFNGGVTVASGDVNGDGKADIIVGAGPGGVPEVRVFSGADNSVLQDFFAYAPTFVGGVYVAAGDVNGDGKADVITGAGSGGGPHVKVFDGTNSNNLLQSYFAYDPGFLGGVFVAAGDVNGDGFADVVTGAGPSASPHVKVFSGVNPAILLASFFAYDQSFTGGVVVASGDVTGDGFADIITGPGPISANGLEVPDLMDGIIPPPGPQIKVFNGTNSQLIGSFLAYSASFQGGVSVAVAGTATAGTPTPTPTATPTASPTPGFEGDVAPRPNGDGIVVATDLAQIRRFAAGLDIPGVGTNEVQRADISPRATFGDGIVNAGDVIQGRRYATGLDPLSGAGGPTGPQTIAEIVSGVIHDVYAGFVGRELKVGDAVSNSPKTLTIPVEIRSDGDEVGASFTLEYDAAKLSNPQVTLGEAAPEGAILTANTNEAGRIGILVDSADHFIAAGMSKQFVLVTFDVVDETGGTTLILLTDSLAARSTADADGNMLSTRWSDGKVVIARDSK